MDRQTKSASLKEAVIPEEPISFYSVPKSLRDIEQWTWTVRSVVSFRACIAHVLFPELSMICSKTSITELTPVKCHTFGLIQIWSVFLVLTEKCHEEFFFFLKLESEVEWLRSIKIKGDKQRKSVTVKLNSSLDFGDALSQPRTLCWQWGTQISLLFSRAYNKMIWVTMAQHRCLPAELAMLGFTPGDINTAYWGCFKLMPWTAHPVLI